MANQNRDIPKQERGSLSTTSRETGVWVQLQPDQLEALDAWIEKQPNPLTRSEAIRRMVESKLKAKPNHSRSSSYSKSQLRDALRTLRATTPLSDRLKEDEDDDYRDRLIKWTIKYSKSRNAREVYNRLQVPEWIIWLNEAAGESPQRIRKAISAMQLGRRAQQRAADVRKVLRWEQTAQLLFDNHGR
jgi:hypothetical protein